LWLLLARVIEYRPGRALRTGDLTDQ